MIAKGTPVCIRTTNGGEMTAPLVLNYRPTYDACVEVGNGWTVILATRIVSVEPVRTIQ